MRQSLTTSLMVVVLSGACVGMSSPSGGEEGGQERIWHEGAGQERLTGVHLAREQAT